MNDGRAVRLLPGDCEGTVIQAPPLEAHGRGITRQGSAGDDIGQRTAVFGIDILCSGRCQ